MDDLLNKNVDVPYTPELHEVDEDDEEIAEAISK